MSGHAPSAPAGAAIADGPLGDLLRDPGAAPALWIAETLGPIASELVAHWPIALSVLAIAGTTTTLGWRRLARRRDDRLLADARLVTVLAPPSVNPAGGEALWANLVGLLRPAWRRALAGQPHLACEYVFTSTGVTIRLWVPGAVPPGLVERAIEAAWPGSHTRTEPANPPLPQVQAGRRRVVTGGELRLARPEALPLRTRFDADPVRALVGAAVGLGRDETACVQVLARPVTGRRVARARRSARHLRNQGASPGTALTGVLSELLDLLTPRPLRPGRRTATNPPARQGRDQQTSLDLSAQARAVVEKQRGSQYETLVRYAAAIDLPLLPAGKGPAGKGIKDEQHRKAQDLVRGRAHALAASFASYTEHNRYTRRRLRRPASVLASRRLGHGRRRPFGRDGDVLSVRELAAIAHLPTDDHVPGLLRAGARAVAPPPGIAVPGPDAKPLGVTDTSHERPVALRVSDARHHLHVIGATGSGKSTLLATMILADADAGRGILLVDPKGDLVTDVLSRLPRRCADRVVLLDADSRNRPPCLNPLDTHPGTASADLTVDNLVSVFRRVYAASWGPRTDDVMRAACLTLSLQHDTPTLAQLPDLLADPARRARLTAAVTDPVLRGFWTWYEQLSDASRAQVVAPLLNKLRAFLLRPVVRDAIAAGPSTIDMAEILDGGICLVRIPKGCLGEETTRLVGSLVVAAAWQATTARARTPQRHRRDAALVIDECHNFLNLPYPIEDMLAEARGFRVAMTLAHQHLGQLPRELREGLSTNARSKIFFNAGPEDARDLARHTAPHLSDHDLTHLGAFHAAARLVLHGEQTPAFTPAHPAPPPAGTRPRPRDPRRRPPHRRPAQRHPGHPGRRARRRRHARRGRPAPPGLTPPPREHPTMIRNPLRQHALRGHLPAHPTPRSANTAVHQAALAGRLTPRDHWIVAMLHEHRVLTATQLTDMAFPSYRSGRQRLRELYQWSVLDRFQPFAAAGSAPQHYVLAPTGAAVLAAAHGIETRDLGYRHDRAFGIAHSLRLAHTIGTNQWFTTLVTSARHTASGHAALDTWWSETRCARHFGDLVRPDGYGRWSAHGRRIEFFLEFDLGTEALTHVAAKLAGYAALAAATGIITPLLLWLPTPRREAGTRVALHQAWRDLDHPASVPVATAAAGLLDPHAAHPSPADAVWLPLHVTGGPRLPLHRLTDTWPHLDEPTEPVPGASGTAPCGKGTDQLPAPSPIPPAPSPRTRAATSP